MAALAPVLPHGAALAVALVTRLVTTVSDLAWGGIALALARSARPTLATGGPAEARTVSRATPVSATRRRHGRHRKTQLGAWPDSPADVQGPAEQGSSPAPVPGAAA